MKLSVIIPVYNSENHLKECIDSVLCQDFNDFELLLVDDGSTDSSGRICDKYAQKDKRVKVIHKPNRGVSSARNLGLEYAKGEWITFVDSDDAVCNGYFNCLTHLKEDIDLVLGGWDWIIRKELKNEKRFPNQILLQSEFWEKHALYPDFPAPWGKFFKRSLISLHKIRFNENIHFREDALFNVEYILECRKILFCDKSIYLYKDSGQGLTYRKPNIKNETFIIEEVHRLLTEAEMPMNHVHEQIKPLLGWLFFNILSSSYTVKQKETRLKNLKVKYGNTLADSIGSTAYSAFLARLLRNNQIKLIVMISELRNMFLR